MWRNRADVDRHGRSSTIDQGGRNEAQPNLVVIMAGAVVLTTMTAGVAAAIFPLLVGVALTGVGYGRMKAAAA